jgi:hypothetical protein
VKPVLYALLLSIVLSGVCRYASARRAREFLTDEEITLIQTAQKIDLRVKAYLQAADLRLKTASDRLQGREPEEGDPLEFFTPEEMLDGYSRILESVMDNLEASYSKRNDSEGLRKALKELRKRTEEFSRELEFLGKIARELDKKELLQLVEKADETTDGAHAGAAAALEEKAYAPNPKQ